MSRRDTSARVARRSDRALKRHPVDILDTYQSSRRYRAGVRPFLMRASVGHIPDSKTPLCERARARPSGSSRIFPRARLTSDAHARTLIVDLMTIKRALADGFRFFPSDSGITAKCTFHSSRDRALFIFAIASRFADRDR